MALDKQVYIYSVDTSAFYNEDEQELQEAAFRLKRENSPQHNYVDDLFTYSIDNNKGLQRTLNTKSLTVLNKVALFESVLTRTLGIKTQTTSEDIIIVRCFHYSLADSLIDNGFIHNNEEYVPFTASAGQIRTKKIVFIKKSVWEKVQLTLMCGLTEEIINGYGGVSINKYLAYLALCESATDPWEKFNIDKVIVVEDFETEVETEFDFVDDKEYSIERKRMKVPINHTDGCGMMLLKVSNKPLILRGPWIKGELEPFPYDEYVHEGNSKVKDIYGQEHDIIAEGIEIILTKSQFKMWKYYQSWDEYKKAYKKYGCVAGFTNIEEDEVSRARLSYQTLQTLTDITDQELDELTSMTRSELNLIANDPDKMLMLMGASKGDFEKKNSLQQALYIYPELLLDSHTWLKLKDTKASLTRKAYSGKINVKGYYTFVAPDLYAFCEWLFDRIENPSGLLKNGEVSCNLFDDGVKVDCLRSPHLYLEHAVRTNVVNEDTKRWFVSKSIHTSIHDPISKILMFDCDGDKLTVSNDETLVSVAERNMQGVVPLYYEMKKAEPEQISRKAIATNLKRAFGGNIGTVSNDITKIWNATLMNAETLRKLLPFPEALEIYILYSLMFEEEFRQERIKLIKLRTMENNFEIDAAKTNYKPKRPKDIRKLFSPYSNNKMKMPYFFQYDKYRISPQDRKSKQKKKQTENWTPTTVNRLKDMFPDVRLRFKTVKDKYEVFDYTKLMKNQPKGGELDNEIIYKYYCLNRDKWKFSSKDSEDSKDKNKKKKIPAVYAYIREELLKVCNDPYYVTDVLVEFLFHETSSDYKTTLWSSFGDIIVDNLKNNFPDRVKLCGKCRTIIQGKGNARKYCAKCSVEVRKEKVRNNVKNLRVKNK